MFAMAFADLSLAFLVLPLPASTTNIKRCTVLNATGEDSRSNPVRPCLCLVFPPTSRLRQCLCLAVPRHSLAKEMFFVRVQLDGTAAAGGAGAGGEGGAAAATDAAATAATAATAGEGAGAGAGAAAADTMAAASTPVAASMAAVTPYIQYSTTVEHDGNPANTLVLMEL